MGILIGIRGDVQPYVIDPLFADLVSLAPANALAF